MTKEKPDGDKLKRLLALALDDAAVDGEAMNALRAARKIVASLGGLDAALKSMGVRQQETPRQNSGGYERARRYAEQEVSNPWFRDIFKDSDERAKAAKEAACKEQSRKDAEQEAKERRDWELKRAMGQGLPIYEALRRRRLWRPGERVDDGLTMNDDAIEFAKMCAGFREGG